MLKELSETLRTKFPFKQSIASSTPTHAPSTLMQEEFENGGFTLKAHQIFSVHITLEEFENGTLTSHFVYVFDETSVREISLSSRNHRFRKVPFSKCFPSTRRRKAKSSSNSSGLKSVFEKHRLRDGLV